MKQSVTLPYPPSLNNLHAVVRGRKILTAEGRRYKTTASAMAIAAGIKPIVAGDIIVTVTLYRPRRAGDIDNFCKAPFDALKGIAWTDDGQVQRLDMERFEDKANPRVVVTIQPVTPEAP